LAEKNVSASKKTQLREKKGLRFLLFCGMM